MDQRTLFVRWLIQLGMWLTCGLFIIACFAWWLLPAYAPRWFGQVAEHIPLLTRPIARRLCSYGVAEYLLSSDLRTADPPRSLRHLQNAYHPLHESSRLLTLLHEASPNDTETETDLIISNRFRYAVTLGVGMDVPP
jgi:hypothetical protein